jgi:betaine-homocysteine S-methyltransferase
MAEFAVQARDMGINYIGICCGAGPHHVRAMAEALGRQVPASKYSPDISLHPIFGDEKSQKKHYRECLYGPISDTIKSEK